MKKTIVPIITVLCIVMLTACAADNLKVVTSSNNTPSNTTETADETVKTKNPDSSDEEQEQDNKQTDTSLQEVFEQMESSELLPDMTPVQKDIVLDSYGFDSEDYTEAVFYQSSDNSLPDEVVLVTANDEEKAEEIEEMLYTRLNTKAEEAQSHSPEHYIIITSCVVERNGSQVALIVSADSEKLTDIYLNCINQ